MRRPLVWFLVLVAVLAPLGCSSGGDKPSADETTTTIPGADATTDGTTISTWPRSPASSVPLPSIPPPQGQPSGTGPTGEQSAAVVKECAAKGSCVGAEAPLVAWPGGELAQISFAQATITGADLRGADASLGEFQVANLSGADLTGANFSGTNLSGADLSGATIVGTDFSGADLTGADLHDAIADGAEFRGALFCNTVMPDGGVRNDDCGTGH